MKKVLLVYPPFCTPASPPYSITSLHSKLKQNSTINVKAIDLNVEFHNLYFEEYKKYFQKKDWDNYGDVSKKCREDFNETYSKNHKLILKNKEPEGFNELLNTILKNEPDIVAFSIVYSSQVFYAHSLISKLNELNIKTIVGGPAVSDKLKKEATFLEDENALLNFLNSKNTKLNNETKKDNDYDTINNYEGLNFSIYELQDYFSPNIVLPLKTSSTCYYKQCAFCSHYSNKKYEEYDLKFIENTIKNNKSKYYFIIDDMIHSKRLLDLAKIFKKYKIEWVCQLKPTKDFSKEILQELKNSGLKFVMWGVESGNNRILKLMGKATNTEDIALILKNSKESGIINTVFVMFGFPTETKMEFKDTINFLNDNKDNIDLVLSSVFGLQKGTKIYDDPEKYYITRIIEEKRTMLEPKISYDVSVGMTSIEASKLRKSHLKFLDKINKFPRKTNFFREHLFFY